MFFEGPNTLGLGGGNGCLGPRAWSFPTRLVGKGAGVMRLFGAKVL